MPSPEKEPRYELLGFLILFGILLIFMVSPEFKRSSSWNSEHPLKQYPSYQETWRIIAARR